MTAGRIERFFHALKQGTRIEDRHLDTADDLRKCFADHAITAFRVWNLTHLARIKPTKPAHHYVGKDDIKVLSVLAAKRGFTIPHAPPDMTLARFVTLTGGLAGFHPSKRQPLPGTEKLWQEIRILTNSAFAIQTWEQNKMNLIDTELSV